MTATASVCPAMTPMSWVISRMLIDSRDRSSSSSCQDLGLDRHVERGGRLVGDEQPRLAQQAHRDHGPLPHAARQLVRVVAEPLGRPGHPDQAEDVGGPAVGRRPGRAGVDPVGLAELAADGPGRVQRRHRVLRDERDVVAPQLPHRGVVQAGQLGAAEPDRAARDGPAGRQQPHHRHPGHGLARARLADQADALALLDAERDAVDRADQAVPGGDLGPQVGDLQQAHAAPPACGRGRRLSLRGVAVARRRAPPPRQAGPGGGCRRPSSMARRSCARRSPPPGRRRSAGSRR